MPHPTWRRRGQRLGSREADLTGSFDFAQDDTGGLTREFRPGRAERGWSADDMDDVDDVDDVDDGESDL